jgi:GAF domain-containing protein
MGIEGAELEGVNTGTLLHDIGKLGVPEYVLLKPGRLTAEEFDKIKKHPEIGAAILDPVEFPWPVLPRCQYHHEKWDGTGYPEGLKGEDIPRIARVMAVADVYDALTSSRPYRQAWSHERAIATIRQDSGTHFDPAVVEAFLEVIEDLAPETAADREGAPAPAPGSERGGNPAAAAADTAAARRRPCRRQDPTGRLGAVGAVRGDANGFRPPRSSGDPRHPGPPAGGDLPRNRMPVPVERRRRKQRPGRCARGARGERHQSPFLKRCRTVNAASRSLAALQTQEPYRGPYEMDDLLLDSSVMSPWTALQSALIVPIARPGEPLGTINLYHPEPEAFTPQDQKLLERIAERVAGRAL